MLFRSLAIGAVGEPVLAHAFEPVLATILAVVLSLLVITFLHVVIGELVPKGIALTHPERTALAVSRPVQIFFVVFGPLIWVLRRSTEFVLRLIGLEADIGESEAHSEAELRMLLVSSAEQGEIEHGEEEMLSNVFEFADKEASDVMVPRPDVVGIDVNMPPEEALAAILESPYTRYPVYRGSLDEIVGVLHVRDLVEALHEGATFKLEELLRPATVVPETKDLAALLTEFRRTSQHLAIVVNEYGATEGIVTLEDLIEQIIGDIEDEFDLPDETVERIDDETIRIDGTFTIDDFNEEFMVALPDENYNTVGGFVFGELGRAPEPGNVIEHEHLTFTVESIEGQRIDKLTVHFAPRADDAEAGDVDGE